jgi:dephospho-CoA kinase
MGVSGSGKDYFVDVMKKEFDFARFSFSDQLKKLGTRIYPWLEEDYPPELKEKPLNLEIPETGEVITKTPREIWLELNKLRNIEDNLFVRMLDQSISRVNVSNYVISDVRTQNEFDWCKKNGFIFVYIKAEDPAHPRNDFDDWVRKQEADETYDHIFNNDFNGDEKIKRFIKILIGERN